MKNREELVTIIDKLKYKIGIEVGVREGIFSQYILDHSNVELLYGVDINPHLYKFDKYGDRWKFHIGVSPEFAGNFPDEYFDFIYIDADHKYESVKADLEGWWPKLKYGGLFFGDDYSIVEHPQEGTYGIVEAVEEFCQKNNINPNITGQEVWEGKIGRKYLAITSGEEANKKLRGQQHNLIDIPNWWIIK